ncbi:MAG: flagellar biosynthetic protein FliR [Chloroflexi bacterium]|nr:flagellar biosynthetic protein FliR [Chloroflexota bacterium]
MDTLNTVVAHPQAYLLLVARASGMFLLAPVLGHTSIPVLIRVALVLLLAWVLFPVYGLNVPETSLDVPSLVTALGGELAVGLVVGMVASLIFTAFQMAGSVIGTQMSFGISELFDPNRQQQVSVIDQFYSTLATLLFLVINGHHLLMQAFDRTFRVVPLAAAIQAEAVALPLGHLVSEMFGAALQLALPILAAVLLTDIASGLVARAIPQINVFFLGLPLKVLVGLFALSLAVPATLAAMTSQIETGIGNVVGIVRTL